MKREQGQRSIWKTSAGRRGRLWQGVEDKWKDVTHKDSLRKANDLNRMRRGKMEVMAFCRQAGKPATNDSKWTGGVTVAE